MKIRQTAILTILSLASLSAEPVLPAIPKAEPVPTPPAAKPEVKEAPKGETTEQKKTDAPEKPAAEEKKAWNANPKGTLHIIESGGSLSAVSEKAYQRTRYWRILKLYNKCDPDDLKIGQEIYAPELPWLLEASGLQGKYPKVAEGILKAHQDLLALEGKHQRLSSENRDEINEIVFVLRDTMKALKAKTPGVKFPPAATMKQLTSARNSLNQIALGTKSKRDFQALAHEHLSNAMVYAVLWSLDGFQ